MGCYIDCEGKPILKLSNHAMGIFYEKLLDLAVQEGLGDNTSIVEFIAACDQEVYGFGAISPDICTIFKNDPVSLRKCLALLEIAIPFLISNYPELAPSLINFKNEVLQYYKGIAH